MNTGSDSHMIIFATNKCFGLDLGQRRLEGYSRHRLGSFKHPQFHHRCDFFPCFQNIVRSYILYIFCEFNISNKQTGRFVMFFYSQNTSLCICQYYIKHLINPVIADRFIKRSYNWVCSVFFKCYVFTFVNKQLCNNKEKENNKPVWLLLGVFQ
jgi:hypothetical protein